MQLGERLTSQQRDDLAAAATATQREAMATVAAAAQRREAAMRPYADKLIAQFQRGLITTGELGDALVALDLETEAAQA